MIRWYRQFLWLFVMAMTPAAFADWSPPGPWTGTVNVNFAFTFSCGPSPSGSAYAWIQAPGSSTWVQCGGGGGPAGGTVSGSGSYTPNAAGTWILKVADGPSSSGTTLLGPTNLTVAAAPTPPPAPAAQAATGITATGFTARWNASSGATDYRLDVSTSSSFSSFVSNYNSLRTDNVTSWSVTGLTPNTTYYYRVRALNAGGTSGNSNTMTVTTLVVAPGAPTASAATSITSNGFTANWSSVSGATSYRLDVSTSSSFGSYVSGYQDLNVSTATSRSVSGLTASTTYYYRVRAVNAGGTSGNSSTITATTSVAAPGAPSASTATSITSTGFTANWSSVSGATSYRLDVSTSSSFGSYVSGYQDLNVSTATSRSVSGLTASTTYYYRVRAVNAGGTSGSSNTVTVTTAAGPPGAPTASAATSVTSTGFIAHWSAVSGATSYRLDVSSSSSFTSYVTGYQDLNVSNVTSRAVSGLAANTTYYYRVRTLNAAGTSANSNTITVAAVDTQSPTQPGPLTFSNITSASVTVNWAASTDNVGVTEYTVSREGVLHATVTGLSFADSGLSASTSYRYSVVAVDAAGNSSTPQTGSVTTVAGTAPLSTIRVNCGGSSYTDSQGNAWSADTGYNTGGKYSTSATIAGTSSQSLFRTERYDPEAAPDLVYAFNVTNGSYTLRLLFAENHSAGNGVGLRVFDVDVQDVRTFEHVDIFAEAGGYNRALIKSVPVTITDGQLRIRFGRQVQNPKINAIELVPGTTGFPPAAPTTASPTNITSNGFTANWSAVPGATGYRLDVSTSSSFGTFVTGYQNRDVGNTTSFAATGLTASTTYYYRVRASNSSGPSGNSVTVAVTTGSGTNQDDPTNQNELLIHLPL